MGTKSKKLKKSIGQKRLQIIALLEKKNLEVEVSAYINDDPIQFMHLYSGKQDRLIAGFFAAIMAWGRRDIVIAKVSELLTRMGNKPEAFIRSYNIESIKHFEGFAHRTFKAVDIHAFCMCFHQILLEYDDFEVFWANCYRIAKIQKRPILGVFHEAFFKMYDEVPLRTRKHLANPEKGSSAKRLWLYLRWCIRKESCVDLGVMDFMPESELMLPLDVHVARWARAFGLLTRTQNDRQSVEQLTKNLRRYRPQDPAIFDYGLFGIGVLKEDVPTQLIVNPWVLQNNN